jgi:glycosyltransferase involved in cell wall biosynthesis
LCKGLTVIIPTYNRKSVLELTIIALMNQTAERSKYEVIVIDDCSADNTAEYMMQVIASEPNVKYIQHKENKGRVVTRNDGIKTACGDIVIFLDDDNIPARNFVEEHLKCYEANPKDKIAVMGNVSYAFNVIGKSNFARYMQSRYLGNRSGKECSGINFKDLPARCLGTLNCSMRRVDLLKAGIFDDSFRYYGGEDEYLGQCLKGKGVRLVFGGGAHSLHYDIVSLPRYKQNMRNLDSEFLRTKARNILRARR